MKNDKEKQAFKNYIDITLEEYKSLRNESRQCSANTFTALYIGFGAIGILCAVGFPLLNGEKTVDSGLIIFGLFVPIIALGISFLILAEATRLKRVGDYICFIEIKLSSLFKEITEKNIKNWTSCQKIIENKLLYPHVYIDLSEPLIWERWLRCSSADECPKKIFTLTGRSNWAYKLRIGLLLAISCLSFGIAAVYYMQIPPESELFLDWTKISITIFLFIFFGVIWVIIYRVGQGITKTSCINMNEKDN